jgi:hypothetical protein
MNARFFVYKAQNPASFEAGFSENVAGEEGFEPSAYGFGDSRIVSCVY